MAAKKQDPIPVPTKPVKAEPKPTKEAKPVKAPKEPKAEPKPVAPKYKFPKTVGACADYLFTLKAKRLEQSKVVAAMEAEESALKEYIIQTLPKSETTGVAGKLARVTVVTKQVPQVKDWDKFRAFIVKNKRWDLMQKQISAGAIKEIWDAKKQVPGVESFTATTISLNKI